MSRTVGLTFGYEEVLTDIGEGLDFYSMTVPELKFYADSLEIDLTGATKKDEIIQRILEPPEV